MLLNKGQEELIVEFNNIAHGNTLSNLHMHFIYKPFVCACLYLIYLLESSQNLIELYTQMMSPKH